MDLNCLRIVLNYFSYSFISLLDLLVVDYYNEKLYDHSAKGNRREWIHLQQPQIPVLQLFNLQSF